MNQSEVEIVSLAVLFPTGLLADDSSCYPKVAVALLEYLTEVKQNNESKAERKSDIGCESGPDGNRFVASNGVVVLERIAR